MAVSRRSPEANTNNHSDKARQSVSGARRQVLSQWARNSHHQNFVSLADLCTYCRTVLINAAGLRTSTEPIHYVFSALSLTPRGRYRSGKKKGKKNPPRRSRKKYFCALRFMGHSPRQWRRTCHRETRPVIPSLIGPLRLRPRYFNISEQPCWLVVAETHTHGVALQASNPTSLASTDILALHRQLAKTWGPRLLAWF